VLLNETNLTCVVAFLPEICETENTPKVSFFLKTLDFVFIFCGQTIVAMAAIEMVSAGGFLGMGFQKKNNRRGSPFQFSRKPLFLGSDFQS
jgi:hypothetical protein